MHREGGQLLAQHRTVNLEESWGAIPHPKYCLLSLTGSKVLLVLHLSGVELDKLTRQNRKGKRHGRSFFTEEKMD